MEKAMNMFLTTPATPRSESLAFLSLSPNDLDCIEQSLRAERAKFTAKYCEPGPAKAGSPHDQAQIALCGIIDALAKSQNADEFVANRDRTFQRYADLMLGLGRIVHALTDPAELSRKLKSQLDAAEKFFSQADERFCPAHLKDQASFSLWELGKTVDLANFINSRPPLPEAKREEDRRLLSVCTAALLFGRMHLDSLAFSISTKRVLGEDLQEVLTQGMRHFVNGHIAIRSGARLRQEAESNAPVELLPLDEEDYHQLAFSTASQDDY
jgi:hypothetical protein